MTHFRNSIDYGMPCKGHGQEAYGRCGLPITSRHGFCHDCLASFQSEFDPAEPPINSISIHIITVDGHHDADRAHYNIAVDTRIVQDKESEWAEVMADACRHAYESDRQNNMSTILVAESHNDGQHTVGEADHMSVRLFRTFNCTTPAGAAMEWLAVYGDEPF